MNYQQERDEFFASLARELPDVPPHQLAYLGRSLCRHTSTLHRLAVAQCNGDYPCDNGDRKVEWCGRCQSGMVRSKMKRLTNPADLEGLDTITSPGGKTYSYLCQDCRVQDHIKTLLKPFGIVPQFYGDPRGCVLKLKFPSGTTNDWGREGVCVPVRER